VVRCGEGPTVGLRADIDGLAAAESADGSHRPAAEGFHSEHEGLMHAYGHDADTAIGIGALERVAVPDSDFWGTFKMFFRPASEIEGGGRAMANGPHVEGVDAVFVVNVGFGHPTGEVVAGVNSMYAIERFRAEFAGEFTHAAKSPETGRNAVQAMANAVGDLYAVPRHSGGPTRVNVGTVDASQATNVIASDATIEGEVRGETAELLRSMQEWTDRVLAGAARMHDCEVKTETVGKAPSADSDDLLADRVYGVIDGMKRVTSPVRRTDFGTGEDAAWLMNVAGDAGGRATHVIIGTDHPTGHHTPAFDVDERGIDIGVEVLARAAATVCGDA